MGKNTHHLMKYSDFIDAPLHSDFEWARLISWDINKSQPSENVGNAFVEGGCIINFVGAPAQSFTDTLDKVQGVVFG